MHDDSVDDSRSNTTDNAVGAAADGNDVIMGGLDAVAVAADLGSIATVSDESGDDDDISDNDIPFGFATANNANCGGVPDELRGLEVISEDVGERHTPEIFLTNMLQLRVHLWACLVSFHHAASAEFVVGLNSFRSLSNK